MAAITAAAGRASALQSAAGERRQPRPAQQRGGDGSSQRSWHQCPRGLHRAGQHQQGDKGSLSGHDAQAPAHSAMRYVKNAATYAIKNRYAAMATG